MSFDNKCLLRQQKVPTGMITALIGLASFTFYILYVPHANRYSESCPFLDTKFSGISAHSYLKPQSHLSTQAYYYLVDYRIIISLH